MSFFFPLLFWWFISTLFGIVGLGIGRRLLGHLPDKGFGFPRMLGLIVVGWLAWFLPGIGLAPFGTAFSFFCLLVGLGGSGYLLYLERDALQQDARRLRTFIIVSEVLFFVALMMWGFVRSYNPDITGTEKLPDYAFMTSFLRIDSLPPEDPWFAGEPINYFYFGHYLMATMTRMTAVPASIGFNCALCFLFALVAQGSLCLAFNFTRSTRGMLLGPVLVLFIGNLFPVYQYYAEWFILPKAAEQYNKPNLAEWGQTDWWWHPSRVVLKTQPVSESIPLPGEPGGPPSAPAILGGLHRHVVEKFQIPGWRTVDETINEFPLWSFVLGDLHAHVMVLPVMLLGLWMLFAVTTAPGRGFRLLEDPRLTGAFLALLAVTLGAIPVTNFWELPGVFIVGTAAVLINLLRTRPSFDDIWRTAVLFGIVLLAAYLLYFPFHGHFVPQTKEEPIAFVPPVHLTSFVHFLYMYGFFFVMTLAYLPVKLLEGYMEEDFPAILAAPLLLGVGAGLWRGSLMFGVLTTLILYLVYVGLRTKPRPPELLALVLAALGYGMVAGCEVIAIKDFYGGVLLRMNTLFKFYYQAWVMLGIACSYFAYRSLSDLYRPFRGLPLRQVYTGVFGFLMFLSLQYTYIGPTAKTNSFRAGGHIPTFKGIGFMEMYHPDDYAAIKWFERNVDGRAVILEAAGRAFSALSRISAATGLPTPLGWDNHQALWRDNTWATVTPRKNKVNELYTSTDRPRVESLLREFQIEYVYIGRMERDAYPGQGLTKFSQWTDLFTLVNDEEGGQIYRVNLEYAPAVSQGPTTNPEDLG